MPMSRAKWLMKKIKGINHDRLNKHLDVMVKNTGKSRAYIKWDIFRNFSDHRLFLHRLFPRRLYKPDKGAEENLCHRQKFYNIIHYFNDPRIYCAASR